MPGRTVASGPPPPERDEREQRQPAQGPEPFLGPYVAPPVGGPSQWMDAAWDFLGGRPAKEPSGYDPLLDVSWHGPLLGPEGFADPAPGTRTEEVKELDDRPSVTTHEEPRRRKPKRSKRKDGGRGGALGPRKRRPRVGGPSGWEKFWGELAAGNNPFTGLPWGIDPATGKPWKQDERRVYAEAEPEGEQGEEETGDARETRDDAGPGRPSGRKDAAPAAQPPCPPPYNVAALLARWESVDARLESQRSRLLAPVQAAEAARELRTALRDPSSPVARARRSRLAELRREVEFHRARTVDCRTGLCPRVDFRVPGVTDEIRALESEDARLTAFLGEMSRIETATRQKVAGRLRTELLNSSIARADLDRLRARGSPLDEAALLELCAIRSWLDWAEYLADAAELAERAVLIAEDVNDSRGRQWLKTKLKDWFGGTADFEAMAVSELLGQDVADERPDWDWSDTSPAAIRRRFEVVREARRGLGWKRRSIGSVTRQLQRTDELVDDFLERTELVLGFTRYVGALLAAHDALVGRSLFTGRKLGAGERAVAGVGFGVSALGGIGRAPGRVARGTSRAGRGLRRFGSEAKDWAAREHGIGRSRVARSARKKHWRKKRRKLERGRPVPKRGSPEFYTEGVDYDHWLFKQHQGIGRYIPNAVRNARPFLKRHRRIEHAFVDPQAWNFLPPRLKQRYGKIGKKGKLVSPYGPAKRLWRRTPAWAKVVTAGAAGGTAIASARE